GCLVRHLSRARLYPDGTLAEGRSVDASSMACCFPHLPDLVPHGGWSSRNKHAPHENSRFESPGGTIGPLAVVRAGQRIARMVQQDVLCSLPEHSENAVRRSAGQATE